MSDSNESEEANVSFEDPYEFVIEFEDLILDTQDLLDSALAENLKKSKYPMGREDIITAVENTLKSAPDESVDYHSLAHAVLHVISTFTAENIDRMREDDAKEDLIDLFILLSSKYSLESTIPNLISAEGDDFWYETRSEVAVRRNGGIGLNHQLVLRCEETVDISSSLNGTFRLIHSLLDAEEKAIDRFGDEAYEDIDQDVIEQLHERIEEIRSERPDTEGK